MELAGAAGRDEFGSPGRTSVIVLNYNGLDQTLQCLSTIEHQTADNLEVIVVDNGSADDEAERIRRRHPGCRVLRLERNHGFAGGVNWGLTLATGEFIVLVNNDCLVERECIALLVGALKGSGHAAVSGRLVDVERPGQVAMAFALASAIKEGKPLPVGTSRPVRRAVAESRQNHGYSMFGLIVDDAFGGSNQCFYPSGGLMAIRRSAIPRFPQLFPHRYFAYHEDAWLGFELRSRGLTVGKEPRAVAIHRAGSTSRSLGRVRLRFLQERNRWLNLLGWLPGEALLKLAPLYLLINLLTLLALIPRPADLLGWLGAQLWLASRPLELLSWRAQCQAGVIVPPEAITEWLSGTVRGRGGMLNALSRWWCKLAGIRTLEAAEGIEQGAHQHG